MKDNLLIIGAGGHGKVVADIAIKMNKWKSIAFLDDNKNIESPLGLKVLGTTDRFIEFINDYDMFVGIGDNFIRSKVQNKLEISGANIPNIIHPNSVISDSVEIGIGTAIMAGAIINCSTKIGRGCIINTGVTVDHDNQIEDYVHISPGSNLAGSVKVGSSSWLGIGCIIKNNVNIASNCIIGAGAVVVKDITKSGTYIGVPARRLKK